MIAVFIKNGVLANQGGKLSKRQIAALLLPFNTDRIDHFYQDQHVPTRLFTPHDGDRGDSWYLTRMAQGVKPDEAYNLAARSHVQVSLGPLEYSAGVDAPGVLGLLSGQLTALSRWSFCHAGCLEPRLLPCGLLSVLQQTVPRGANAPRGTVCYFADTVAVTVAG